MILDTTGVGKPIFEDLRQEGVFVEDYTFTGKSKEELIGKLIVAVEEKYIRLLPIPVAIDEIKAFEFKYLNEKTGLPLKNIQYGAPQNFHDDTVCARALAVWGLTPGKAKLQSSLQVELSKIKSKTKFQYL